MGANGSSTNNGTSPSREIYLGGASHDAVAVAAAATPSNGGTRGGMLPSSCPCNATRWACEQAAAHHSPADCDGCTWWQPPDLALSDAAQLARVAAPTTAWFMCVNKPQGGVSLLRARHSAFIQLVQVAVVSARLHAPSLQPYVLYMHGDDQTYDDTDEVCGRCGLVPSLGGARSVLPPACGRHTRGLAAVHASRDGSPLVAARRVADPHPHPHPHAP
jgi:hypothetical protein